VITLYRVFRREPGEHIAVAGVRCAPAAECLALGLGQRSGQLGCERTNR